MTGVPSGEGWLSAAASSYRNTLGFFTVVEVVAIIVEFERIDRPKSQWFGGIDCHHVSFEGLRLNSNSDGDAFCISWRRGDLE